MLRRSAPKHKASENRRWDPGDRFRFLGARIRAAELDISVWRKLGECRLSIPVLQEFYVNADILERAWFIASRYGLSWWDALNELQCCALVASHVTKVRSSQRAPIGRPTVPRAVTR